jgi:hypothetical protein
LLFEFELCRRLAAVKQEGKMQQLKVEVQDLDDEYWPVHQQLWARNPDSVLVADAAQAAEDLQRSAAIDAADAQTLLQTALQNVQTQRDRAASMLADLIDVPVSIVKQLNDKQQDSVQSLVAFLKQHKLQGLCIPILQRCPNGKRLSEMTAAVDCFARQTGPESAKGVVHSALQLLCELQQLVAYGMTDTYLQLCEMLLVAATPRQLRDQLQRVGVQLTMSLHAIRCEVAVKDLYAAQAAATAAATAAVAASNVPASTLEFSAAVLAELNASLAESQSPARYEYSCSNSLFSAGSSSSSSSSMPSWHASTAAAPATPNNNISAAADSGVPCTSAGSDAASSSRRSSSLQEQYDSAPAAGEHHGSNLQHWQHCSINARV